MGRVWGEFGTLPEKIEQALTIMHVPHSIQPLLQCLFSYHNFEFAFCNLTTNLQSSVQILALKYLFQVGGTGLYFAPP